MATISVARAAFDPSLTWKTISTDHFYIHYHDGEEDFAQRAAVAAEKVFYDITGTLNWTPDSRTHIVLNDRFEVTNGWAIPFPDKYINIYTAAPDDINSLEDHNGWLEMVIEHEYVHIVHLDKVSGVPQSFRKLFGSVSPLYFPLGIFNFSYPNLTQPRWLIEGLATYVETHEQEGIGRGQSSYFNMLMRIDVANGIKSIYDVNANRRLWPGGATPYLYGVNFFQFLDERYGKEKIKQLIEEYSDNWLGYFINLNSRQVLRKNLSVLWSEFERYMREKHQPVIDAIVAKGEVAGTQLTHFGYSTRNVKATSDGSVYFVRADQKQDSAIMRILPGQTEVEFVARLHEGARFDVSDNGDIVAAQFEFNNNYNMYYELFDYDAATGRWRQLTDGGRYHFVAISPDGQRLAAVYSGGGETRLEMLDRQGRVLEILRRGDYNMTISSIDWSPDGRAIAAGIWRKDRGWNIEELDVDQRLWREFVTTASVESHPQYNADSKEVYFTADYDGVYNIHRYDRASGRIDRVTNVVGGGFYPAPTAQGLYYIGAHSQGFDLYRIDDVNALDTRESEKSGRVPEPVVAVETPAPVLTSTFSSDDYFGFRHLKPKWWWPIFYASSSGNNAYGIATSANDPLEWHGILAEAFYSESGDAWAYSFDYAYSRYWPKLHLLSRRTISETFITGIKQPLFVEAKDKFQVDIQFPFHRYRSQYDVTIGASISDRSLLESMANVQLFNTREGYFGAAIEFNSATEHALSVSAQEGRFVRLMADTGRGLQTPFTGDAVVGDWREYVHVGGTRVFALRALGGVTIGDAAPFILGDGGESAALSAGLVPPTFGERQYDIRGYYTSRKFLYGNRLFIASAEIRLPLGWVQKSLMIPPIGLGQWRGSLFYDAGSAWKDTDIPDTTYQSVGAELAGTLQLFYLIELPVRVFYARALTTNDYEYLMSIGWSF